jgi:DNA-binding GntR family transcriptional regulator
MMYDDVANLDSDGRTQAPRTYLALRNRIVAGNLAPRMKLKIADLAMEFSVSPGAVREALSRLATDGLVEARDQRGFRVAPISLAALDDLTQTRIQIEGLALAQSIERGDREWEEQLRAAHDAMAAHPPRRPLDTNGSVLHARFHEALVSGCGSPVLIRIRNDLYDHAERYRFLALNGATAAPRPVAHEHAAILAAALERQKAKAVKALSEHIRLTAQIVRDGLGAAGG